MTTTSKPKQKASTTMTVGEAIQQIIRTPLFYEWCKGAFWGLLKDQSDLENKIKNLIEIDDFTSLDTDEGAVKGFELFLGRPYTAWLEKRSAAAHSMYQTPVPFIDERQLKIDVINAGINEQMAPMTTQ
ncbi:MAG TPA: hypothetical protein PL131_08175 [Methylotenera sp.]|nr:hypothetical protein [Methylotenera sp.]HPN01013.1 hypothetical protein [Methylotenera sp.]